MFGIPLLYPWANRLGGWSYEACGRRVELDRGSPLLHGDEHCLPIHGALAGASSWRVVERGDSSLTADARLRRPSRRARSTSSAGSTSAPAPRPFLTGMLLRKVPKGTNWFYTLGSATLFAFVVQALTGVFLAMYYVPSATEAYDSITHLTNDVFLGEFVRGLHKWGATVMIILIFLHMGRTFVFGAYKYPRELNWVIGVVLLILTLVMGLTGYLLPFDQRSYWATIVAMNITASGPVVGPYLADFLRAGSEFTATTLPRFYAVHMLARPGADHRPDRRSPLSGGEARDHRAAVAARRIEAEVAA